MYITLRYLPEIFRLIKRFQSEGDSRYEKETTRIRNPLWTDNLIKNCLNSQLLFRIEGELNETVGFCI